MKPFASFNGFAADLARAHLSRINSFATYHENRATIYNVKEVGVVCMNLDLTWLLSSAGDHFVFAGKKKRFAFFKALGHFFGIEIDRFSDRR